MKQNNNYCVYMHTNKINGKRYVGQTCKKPEYRWVNGKGYKGSPHFFSAIQKYGWNNFEHQIIAEKLSKQEADNLEKELISKYKTQNEKFGYNLTLGGEGTCGLIFSEEHRKKLSKAKKGKKRPPISEEQKRKLSKAKKGKKRKDYHFFTNGEINKFCKECPEGFWPGRTNKGTKPSEEAIRKRSETVKDYHYFTNGEINKLCKECPEGFWPGRVLVKRKN